MRELNFDIFDPTTMVTDSDCSSEDSCDHCDFRFAFNDPNFSDRVLRIHMFSEPIDSTPGCTKQRAHPVRGKTLHVSSPILAARSSFFHKLISNGQRYIPLHINVSEEGAFMELLNFMYSSKLTVTTAPDVLDVLRAADKFEVASCMRHCGRLLRNLQMTPESVLVYLDLPSTLLTAEEFQPLTVASKLFYAVHYKDMTKYKKELLGLPLAGVEAIIASDNLNLNSENAVYRFVLKWALAHYPNKEARREIIATRLAKFIRFPYMTRKKLTQVLTCNEFDPKFAQRVVREALSFKAEVPNMEHTYIRDENSILNRWFVERAYTSRPVKLIEYEQLIPHCVVYLDLKRDMCASLFPSGEVFSEAFNLGSHRDQWFYLLAQCSTDGFGLYLCMKEQHQAHESASYDYEFEYEFAARTKPTNEFVSNRKKIHTYKDGKAIGIRNLFSISWTSFIGEDSVCFIDGVLHLRVELTELS